MSKHLLIRLIGAAILVLVATALGDVPRTVNYQGHLLDSEGQPVSASVPMTFTIYDDSLTGSALWEHIAPGVEVESGSFSIVLGDGDNPIPDSAFSGSEAWLEIVVNGEAIDPRTRITATPYSFSSRSVKGDFESAPGRVTLSESGERGGFMDLMSHSGGNSLSMTMADPTDEGAIGMFDYNGGQPQAMLEMKASKDLGGSLELWAPVAGFPIEPHIWMGAIPGPERQAVIKMQDPDGGGDLLSLKADPDSGSSFELWGPVAGIPIEPHIWMGTIPGPDRPSVIKMQDPDGGNTLMELVAAPDSGGSLGLWGPTTETTVDPFIWMGTIPNADRHAVFTMQDPSSGHTLMELMADAESGSSFEMWGPLTGEPVEPCIWMGDAGGTSHGGIFRMADPTDDADHRALLELSTNPMTGGELRLFSPQPESAIDPAVRLDLDALTYLNVECGGKSTWRTIFGTCGVAFDDTTAETLKVAMDLGRIPYEAWYMADGLKAGAMIVTDTKVGIGVDDPNESLVIGKDLGGWAGNRLVIGDDTPYVQPGLVVGEDNSYRGWFLWDVDSNYIRMGLKQGTTSYTKVLNIFGNGVGIKKTFPDYPLDVNGDIQCMGIHEGSDGRLKSNIRQLSDALGTIEQIDGVSFEWNEQAESRGAIAGRRDIGVIAEEVEKVLPELIYTDSEGYKSVSYTKLVPVLIEAVKDQQATIDDLSAKVERLNALVQKMAENQ